MGQQRYRDPRAGADATYYAAEGRAARPGEPALVLLESDRQVAALLRLHAARLRHQKKRYPVLYLMHGWGENEQGWHAQGHADLILDNLIAAKKAKPMIIVMDNLNAAKPGEDAAHLLRPLAVASAAADRAPGRRAPRAPRQVRPGQLYRRDVHRDDVDRPDPDGRADLSRATGTGEPRDGRAVDGRHADLH